MGPRSCERGRSWATPHFLDCFTLQWGRVRVNAEGGIDTAAEALRYGLQWGRVRVNAEGDNDPRGCCLSERFNGAAFV